MSGETKAELIHGIRVRLPWVAIGHPDLASVIGAAMDAVEGADRRELRYAVLASTLRSLADPTEPELKPGTVVRGFESNGRSWLGLIVQVGDEDEGHAGAVLVHMEDGPGYPCWWASWVVVPLAVLEVPT